LGGELVIDFGVGVVNLRRFGHIGRLGSGDEQLGDSLLLLFVGQQTRFRIAGIVDPEIFALDFIEKLGKLNRIGRQTPSL
jgi:hypothetical protein